jgi:hypothetical protein
LVIGQFLQQLLDDMDLGAAVFLAIEVIAQQPREKTGLDENHHASARREFEPGLAPQSNRVAICELSL